MKKGTLLLSKALLTLLLTGCVQNPMLPSHLSNAGAGQKSLVFKTNQSTFISELNNKTTKVERNSFIHEFILKSDMQCQKYLSVPQSKDKPNNASKNELYMSMFDTVSAVFGISYITNTAKTMLSGNGDTQANNQEAYEKALSPEIQRGVEINRARYAKKIQQKEPLPTKKYTITQLQKDMLIYDKQCNEEYGLIEINRALKAMQQNINQPPVDNKPRINIEAIKNKVTKVTKEVEKKEKIIKQKDTNATTKKLPL